MPDFILKPWPWYIAGPLIGLVVPVLLLLGNKSFGISSSFRHVCAACIPSDISFFRYNWKEESWNLVFVSGILIGGFIASGFLSDATPIAVSDSLATSLAGYGITDYSHLLPADLFNWETLFSAKGFVLMIIGGFLVGFGSRYAGGCTSGHAIMGLSSLQIPSLIATICFMIGGFLVSNFVLPHILSW